MTLYCDVDGTLLDSSARHEKLLRDLLAARGLLWPAAAPDYLRYKADGHSTKAWLMLAGFAPETCAELATSSPNIWRWTRSTPTRCRFCRPCGQQGGTSC